MAITDADVKNGVTAGNALKAAGFKGNDIEEGIAAAYAESKFNTSATNANKNGTTDYGEWQINSAHTSDSGWSFGSFPGNNWADRGTNAKMAKFVFDRQGWGGWSTHNNKDWVTGRTIGQLAMMQITGGTGVGGSDTTGVAGDINSATSPFQTGIQDFIKGVENPHLWQRIATVAIGAVLTVAALVIIGKPFAEPVIKNAKKVAAVAAL